MGDFLDVSTTMLVVAGDFKAGVGIMMAIKLVEAIEEGEGVIFRVDIKVVEVLQTKTG